MCVGGARALEDGAAVGNSDDGTTSEVVGAYLRRFLAECFPKLGEGGGVAVEAEWTGVLGFTSDGKPIVGEMPSRPGVFVAAGFNGHGMPQCFGAGKAIACMIAAAAAGEAAAEGRTASGRDAESHGDVDGGADGDGAPDGVHPFLRDAADPARFIK